MITEGIFDDIDGFNQACRVVYYTLFQFRKADGHLGRMNMEALEQALNNAVEQEPRLQRVKPPPTAEGSEQR